MKIFVYLCALLISTADSAVETEQHYFNYIAQNHAVNKLAISVTTYLGSVNDQVYDLALDFHKNVSTIRQNYGAAKFEYYKRKLTAAKNPRFSRVCLNYVDDLLGLNEKYQREILDLIDTILTYFKTAYVSIYEEFMATKSFLTEVEKEAFDCGDLFEGKDYLAPWICSENALVRTRSLQDEVTRRIPHLLQTLTEQKIAALNSLHQEVANREIFDFYDDENKMNRELRRYCAQ